MGDYKVGDILYWTRVVANCDIFEVIPLKIHAIRDTYFLLNSVTSAYAYVFSFDKIDKILFDDKLEAESRVSDALTAYYATHSKTRRVFKGFSHDTDEYE